jgi:regulator of replication initiation timing
MKPSKSEVVLDRFSPLPPAFCRSNTITLASARRLTLAEKSRLDYCICKQYSKGVTVDPYEIEDTSEWPGSPTRLETVKHYASMLEEDVQDLKRQLQAAKENISSLVEMNDQLSADLQKRRTWMANLEAETTDQLAQIRSLTMVLDQKERIIRELQSGTLNQRN